MAFDNTVVVIGNMTRDPELRFTPSGQPVAGFGLAVNRKWNNRQTGEQQEQTSFFDVTCWAQLGENVAESLSKGDRVVVTGRLEQRSWETQEGEKRSKVEIIADEVSPSLRWATARVQKNERREGGGGGGQQQGPVGASAGAGGGGGYAPDEEPF